MPRRQWKACLSPSELWRGWVFFAVYLVAFPLLMGKIQQFASDREVLLPVAEANVVYYFLATLLLLLLLWSFLKQSFSLLLDWLPENLFGLVTGLLGAVLLSLLVRFIPLPIENPVIADYPAQFQLSPAATLVLLVVLMPLVEEILFRGLLFGTVRRYSRILAYLCSALLFPIYCVYQWAVGFGDPRYLLLMIQYLPASLALSWCYDVGGSVWTAAALHIAINGIGLITVLN